MDGPINPAEFARGRGRAASQYGGRSQVYRLRPVRVLGWQGARSDRPLVLTSTADPAGQPGQRWRRAPTVLRRNGSVGLTKMHLLSGNTHFRIACTSEGSMAGPAVMGRDWRWDLTGYSPDG